MSDWQPIATAPKDGQVVDLWVCGDKTVKKLTATAKRNKNSYSGRVAECFYGADRWWHISGFACHKVEASVIGWRPITENWQDLTIYERNA